MNDIILLYLAKPTYGGWVSFTANLAKIRNTHIIKVSKKTEMSKKTIRYRDFGYGVKYRNMNIDDILKLNSHIIICAIDKQYHYILDKLPSEKTTLVIHDPTEIKTNKQFILSFLNKFKIITIRKSVNNFLLEKNINNKFLYHPYIKQSTNFNPNKSGCVSISRIDWDKNTDILLKANKIMDEKIDIWGSKNDRYVHLKLSTMDSLNETDITSNYKGKFPKEYDSLKNILNSKQFVIDLSSIKNDGGGSQYTFLEAIDFGCILILNKNWTNINNSIWKDKYNCLIVENENDIKKILTSNEKYLEIIENSKKILENSTKIDDWLVI